MILRGVLYLIIVYLLLVYNVLYGSYDGFIALIFVLTALPASFLILILQRFFVKAVSGREGLCVQRLENYRLETKINNPTIFPITGGTVIIQNGDKKEKISFGVPALNRAAAVRKCVDRHCTVHTYYVEKIYLYDYFRIFRLKLKGSCAAKVTVLPRLFDVDVDEAGICGLIEEDDEGTADKSGHDYGEIYDIREYRDGDAIKNIHQKLSCRMNRLMVKEYGRLNDDEQFFAVRLLEGKTEEEKDTNDLLLEGMYAAINCLLLGKSSVTGILLSEDGGIEGDRIDGAEKLQIYFRKIIERNDRMQKGGKNRAEVTMDRLSGISTINLKKIHFFTPQLIQEELEAGINMQRGGGKVIWYAPSVNVNKMMREMKEINVACLSYKGGGQICLEHM